MRTFWIMILVLFVGCATQKRALNPDAMVSKKRSIAGVYGDKADQMPSNLSKPSAQAVIDEVHLKSQADYHFTLAEIYSASNNTKEAIAHLQKTLVYDPKSTVVLLKLASEYIKAGQITKAIATADAVLEIDPQNYEATIFLGKLYVSIQMYPQAEVQYRKALTHHPADHPKSLEVSLYLGVLLFQQSKTKEASNIFKNIVKHSNDKKHLAYYYLGQIAQSQEDLSRAEKHYKDSLKAQEDFVASALALAEIYEVMDQLAKALKILELFQKTHGPNEQMSLYLAKIYIQQQDYDKAYEQYEIISAFHPEDVGFKIRMAFILIKQKKYKKALADLQSLIPQSPQADRIRFYIGAIYEETDQKDKAVKEFLQIPITSSYYTEARIYAAYLENNQGNVQNAVQILEESIAKKPSTPKFFVVYASLLNEMKQHDKAIKSLRKAIKNFPRHQQLHFILGSLYDKIGKKEKTIETMKYVLSLNPQHVEALNYLAYTYAEMNRQLDEAEEMARQALSLKPNDGYIQDTLGWIMFKRGDIKASIKLLESAHKINSEEGIIAEHLGDAYHKDNSPEKALEMYRKAYEVEKGDKEKDKIQSKIKAITDVHERSPAAPAQ